MYGWRCKIGLITPPDNFLIEPELYRHLPDGVSIHSSRLSSIDLAEMVVEAAGEAEQYGTMGIDVLAYACNLSSFHQGPGSDEELAAQLSEAGGGIPATTASTAMVRALDTLGAKRVSVVTPYDDADNEKLRRFLVGNGLSIESMHGLGLSATAVEDVLEISKQTATDTYRRVMETASNDHDAVLVTATNLASLETINLMERDIGVPVVAANQAILWHALTLAGVEAVVPEAGQLLAAGPS